jgi:hypothetical protein
LGDRRLTARLLQMTGQFYDKPTANIPLACGSRKGAKAAYRFLDSEDVSWEAILRAHYAATEGRVQDEELVLVAQDTTTLNYSSHPNTKGLGPIGNDKEDVRGLMVHDTMAFTPQGTPLGLLDVQCWARDAADFGKRARRHQVPLEAKESYKWLKSYHAVAALQAQCPTTQFISTGDREADIYELFEERFSRSNGPEVLVRARHDRLLQENNGHLWAYVQRQAVSGRLEIQVPRHQQQPARRAQLEIRFTAVELKPPARKKHRKPLKVWAILAQEINPPANVKEPLEWLLLTTIEVTTFEQATEKLVWYTRRWGIEVYHRTLKSGCKIEERQFGHADRLEACLAVDLVVAWRIFYLTKLGREVPEVPCTVFFEDAEWKALMVYKTQNPLPPEKPPTLRQAIHLLATLGGFLGRKGDGEPGTKSLWLGLQRLDDLTAMWKIMSPPPAQQNKASPVSSN